MPQTDLGSRVSSPTLTKKNKKIKKIKTFEKEKALEVLLEVFLRGPSLS